jgi:hypothetical protein
LEKRAEQFCLEVRRVWKREREPGREGGEMAQTIYVHTNK